MTNRDLSNFNVYLRWGGVMAAAILVIVLIYLNQATFVVLTVSYLLAYVLNPLVEKFESHKFSRFWSIWMLTGIAFIILVLIFFIIVPQIQMQTRDFKDKVPDWVEQIETTVRNWLDQNQTFNENIKPILKQLHQTLVNNKSYEEATFSDYAVSIWNLIRQYTDEIFVSFKEAFMKTYHNLTGLIVTIINLIMFPVFTFYFLQDYKKINEGFYQLMPPQQRAIVGDWMEEIDLVLGRFIRGQFTIACILALIYAVGLSILQVPMGVVIGIIAGMANMVPYIGIVVGLAPALLFALMDNASLLQLFWVTMVFVGGQMLEGMYLSPRIMSDEVGLHPVAVMVSILVGGTLFGLAGVLLAVPVAAILKVIFWRLHKQWKSTWESES